MSSRLDHIKLISILRTSEYFFHIKKNNPAQNTAENNLFSFKSAN